MPLVRMIISTKPSIASEATDAFVNTVYFNVSGSVDDPDYTQLVSDVWDAWVMGPWAKGSYVDVRAYDMADAEPRPQKARRASAASGTRVVGVPQVALALSYFADRNLPRQRGRIFVGPWVTGDLRPTTTQQSDLLALATRFAGIGGLNVDWSLYSPTTGQHTRISDAWVDNAWDIIRSRRFKGTSRVSVELNG